VSTDEAIWQRAVLAPTATIQDAIRNLEKTSIKIVLLTDDCGRLIGTVSDGDIRRGLLRGVGLESLVSRIANKSAFVVTPDMDRELVRQLMVANKYLQIPIVDQDHRVVGLHLWDELSIPTSRLNLMVIMAGGKGVRLRPYTESCPKPLLPIAGKPMLEHIIDRAKADGFSRFVIAIHYLGHMIEEKFGDGSRLGVSIRYLREEVPMGTAGALGLLSPPPERPFVVTNGDVITDINYGEFLDFHVRHNAAATMAVRVHEWQHPYGVVQLKGLDIVGFEEKPIAKSHINAGIYALNPQVLGCLESNQSCDMPTLFGRLMDQGGRTIAYPMHEPWLDVGRADDLENARNLKSGG
jgi:dTDP-glucose pyrophosphorylase